MNRIEEIRERYKVAHMWMEKLSNHISATAHKEIDNSVNDIPYLLSEIDRFNAELEEAKSETKSIFDVSIDHESAIEENYKSIIEKLTAELETKEIINRLYMTTLSMQDDKFREVVKERVKLQDKLEQWKSKAESLEKLISEYGIEKLSRYNITEQSEA